MGNDSELAELGSNVGRMGTVIGMGDSGRE